MAAKLLVKKASGSEQFDLASELTSIGRSDDNSVTLDDAASSRHHAQIRLENGRYTLIDLGSLNGTLVNGEPATGSRELQDGDVITIGTTNMVFTAPPEAATQAFGPVVPQQQPVAPPRPAQPPVSTPPPVMQSAPKPPTAPVGPVKPVAATAGAGAGARPAGAPATAGARPVAAPKRKSRTKLIVIIAVVVLVLLLLACAGVVALAFSQNWIAFQ